MSYNLMKAARVARHAQKDIADFTDVFKGAQALIGLSRKEMDELINDINGLVKSAGENATKAYIEDYYYSPSKVGYKIDGVWFYWRAGMQ